MNPTIKYTLGLFGLLALFVHAIVLYIIFLAAYISGGLATVTINAYGEEHIEFICIPLTIILGIYGINTVYKEYIREKILQAKKVKNYDTIRQSN